MSQIPIIIYQPFLYQNTDENESEITICCCLLVDGDVYDDGEKHFVVFRFGFFSDFDFLFI